MNSATNGDAPDLGQETSRPCQSIEWYSEGDTRIVEVDGVRIAIRFVGRRGRRARIAISAPPSAIFRTAETEVA